MALSRNETPVTFSSVSSVTLSSSAAVASDAILFDAKDIAGAVQINASYSGTAASGDTLSIYAAYTAGDTLGDSTDDYDTTEHAQFIGILDLYASNTPGENPARKTVTISTIPKGMKLIVQTPYTNSHAVVVKARLITQRAE